MVVVVVVVVNDLHFDDKLIKISTFQETLVSFRFFV